MKNLLQRSIIGILVSSFLFMGSAFAFGPSTAPHGNGITLDPAGSGQGMACTLTEIQAGRRNCPSGLQFPSFNNFLYASGSGAFIPDERDFVRVKNITTGVGFQNSVPAQPGDVLLIQAFIHNNGVLGQYAANNVQTRIEGFSSTGATTYASASGNSLTFTQHISSSNATPSNIYDDFTVTSTTGTPIRATYRSGDAVIIPYPSGTVTSLTNGGLGVFGSGSPIGDRTNPTGGTFLGCMSYAMVVNIWFDVVAGDTTTDVSITKSANPTTIGVNGTTTYTLNYANTGATAQGVTITDVITPSGGASFDSISITQQPSQGSCSTTTTGISCTLGTLANGASGQIRYTVRGTAAGTLANRATIATTTAETNTANNTANASVTINAPRFTIQKLISRDGATFVDDQIQFSNGETAFYSILLQNSGSGSGSVRVYDQLSAATNGGSLTLTGGVTVTPAGACTGDLFNNANPLVCTLSAGSTVNIRYNRIANTATVPTGGSSDFLNTATLLDQNLSDTARATLQGIATTRDLAVNIEIDDNTLAPSLPTVPTVSTYTVFWDNLGNAAMPNSRVTTTCDTNAVSRIVSAPGGVVNGTNITFGPFNANSGDHGSFSFEAEVRGGFGDPTPANFSCSAHIESSDFPINTEVNQANNDDTVTAAVDPANRDARSKRVTNLRTGITGTSIEALEGDDLMYVLRYRAGDTPVTGFVFQDDISDILQYSTVTALGGGTQSGGTITWPAVDIPAFGTHEVQFYVQVHDNIESVGGDYALRNAFGNDVTVVTIPHLTRQKTVSINGAAPVTEAVAYPGDLLTYTLRVNNGGNTDRNGFVFADDITDILQYTTVVEVNGGRISKNANNEDIISWDPITIPANASVEKVFSVRIQNPLIAGGDYTLRNVFGNAITVVTIPDVLIAKRALNQRTGEQGLSIKAEENDFITYTLTATERGGRAPRNNFVFSDDITDVLQYAVLQSISDGGVLDPMTRIISWPAATLPMSGALSRTFVVRVNPQAQWVVGNDATMINVYGDTVRVDLASIVVDTHIEKTVSDVQSVRGQSLTYTLRYYNEGERDATGVVIVDDIDESKLNLDQTSLPVNCVYQNLNDPLNTRGGPFGIRCQIGSLPANGTAQNIVYRATIRDTAETDIVNTASISQNEVDVDPSDNQASAQSRVNVGGISLNKSVNSNTITTGQRATYTIVVQNTSAVAQSFHIRDTLSAGNNGGLLNFEITSQRFVFTPLGSGQIAGTVEPGPLAITNMQPGSTLTITYDRMADNTGIPFNQSSHFVNTAEIPEIGLTDTAEIFILGPTSGGGGGGGGGGGSGSRRVSNSINLFIQKEVLDINDKWQDANTADLAAIIGNKEISEVKYRITVKNEGNEDGKDLEVEDIFSSKDLQRKEIKDIKGATWNEKTQIFTLSELPARKSAVIEYMSVFETTPDYDGDILAENTATLMSAEHDRGTTGLSSGSLSAQTQISGIGKKDSAFIKTEIPGKISLKKTVTKSTVNAGDDFSFHIIVENKGKFTYKNLVVSDQFPFEHLNLISAGGLKEIKKEEGIITFGKDELKPGEIWIIKIMVRAQSDTPNLTNVINSVTIEAENDDLSSLRSSAEVLITRLTMPAFVPQTGFPLAAVATIFFAFLFARFGKRLSRFEK